mmetsp:Transcript_21220/g.50416  ORF Transcript_21220/g.50416 Transcript_21220/m.50416 type:complete len:294 (-) Transcript_21220:32-913(-)
MPVSVDLRVRHLLRPEAHARTVRKGGLRLPVPRRGRPVGFREDEVLRLLHLRRGDRGRSHRNRRRDGPGSSDAGDGDQPPRLDRHDRHDDRPDLEQRGHPVRYLGSRPDPVRPELLLHLPHRRSDRQDEDRRVRQEDRKGEHPDLPARHDHRHRDAVLGRHRPAAVERKPVVLPGTEAVLLRHDRRQGGRVRPDRAGAHAGQRLLRRRGPRNRQLLRRQRRRRRRRRQRQPLLANVLRTKKGCGRERERENARERENDAERFLSGRDRTSRGERRVFSITRIAISGEMLRTIF